MELKVIAADDMDGKFAVAAPPVVDQMWQAHVLDNVSYAQFCVMQSSGAERSGGRLIDYDGMETNDKARIEKTLFALKARFGEGNYDKKIWGFDDEEGSSPAQCGFHDNGDGNHCCCTSRSIKNEPSKSKSKGSVVSAGKTTKTRKAKHPKAREGDKTEQQQRKCQPPCRLSPELQAVVGRDILRRPQVISALWKCIRENCLQKDPNDKRRIFCDDKLRKVMSGQAEVTPFSMTRHISQHMLEKVDRSLYKP
jgi:upstream activation factor subunit UAF30